MRRLRVMLLCLGGFLTAVIVINWAVNPYGAWRSTVIDRAHRVIDTDPTEASERVTIAYHIRAERPASLLVGSSRIVLGMNVDDARGEFFNASMSGVSLTEIAAILRLARTNPRLKRVIWGVEFYAFDGRFEGFRHPETRMRLEGGEREVMALRIKETLLSQRALEDSWRVVLRAVRGRRTPPATPVPWSEEMIRARLDDPGGRGLAEAPAPLLKAQLANWVGNYSAYRSSVGLASLFHAAVADVRGAGIDVVLFVPPMSRCELEAIDQTGSWDAFQRWKRQLVEAGPYWDFSGYGKLDRLDSLFLDVAHFWPAVGQAMLRLLLGQDCRECGEAAKAVREAGVWVDARTIDAYLAQQDIMRATARLQGHRCTRVVAEMLQAKTGAGATRRGAAPGPPPR